MYKATVRWRLKDTSRLVEMTGTSDNDMCSAVEDALHKLCNGWAVYLPGTFTVVSVERIDD